MKFGSTLLCLILVMAAGCASDKANQVTQQEFERTSPATAQARRLSIGDRLELAVEVNGETEVAMTELEVGHEGTIPAPLVGDVYLASMTMSQARAILERRYSRVYVGAPLITLRMADDGIGEWGYVTVLGQVRNPGRYQIASSAGMNLSDALHEAGGFAPSANMSRITVSRTTTYGTLVQSSCDITELGRSGSGQRDLVLYNGDIVQVPERVF